MDDSDLPRNCAGPNWYFRLREGRFTGTGDELQTGPLAEIRQARGFAPPIFEYVQIADGRTEYRFARELVIAARDRKTAQRVIHLLSGSLAVIDGGITFGIDEVLAVPENHGDLEGLSAREAEQAIRTNMAREGFLRACVLTSRASRSAHSAYAIFKLLLSYRAVSPHMIDLHPRYEPRKFGIETDRLFHTYLSNAITLAYSAIEEMQLELRASRQNPSRLPNGNWNPKVIRDLEARLSRAGIKIPARQIWTLRGPPTRIERGRKVVKVVKPSWSRGSVRDVEIPIHDALGLASWLRSRVTTHRFNEHTTSLTVYDAHNVQFLARRLLMERFGFWH